MTFIINILVILAIVSVLVIAHEWGHFIVARIFKIRVDDFSIGFGPRLIRFGKLGNTEYNLRALPLGGFVRIAGMDADEEPLIRAKDAVLKKVEEEGAADAAPAQEPSDGLFNGKPLWQRALVIFAGPLASFVFGYLIFCLLGVTVGLPDGPATNRISMVMPGGQAYQMGLRAGDTITDINGHPIHDGDDMVNLIHLSYGKQVVLTVLRDGTVFTAKGVPQQLSDENGDPSNAAKIINPGGLGVFGIKTGDVIDSVDGNPFSTSKVLMDYLKKNAGKTVDIDDINTATYKSTDIKAALPAVLVAPTTSDVPLGMLKFSPAQGVLRVSLRESIERGNLIIVHLFGELASMFQHHQMKQIKDSVGGPVMIYEAINLAVKNGLPQVLFTAGSISISLAIFNLLPIPVLDGGHLMGFFIEWIRRGKRFSEQQQQAILLTGMAIIGILFVLFLTKDIHSLLTHQLPQ